MPTPSVRPSTARWLLTTHHANADRVFYAHVEEDGLTTWTPMVRSGPASDEWTLKVNAAPLPGQFRVYTVVKESVMNCGGSDLRFDALRPTEADPVPRRSASA